MKYILECFLSILSTPIAWIAIIFGYGGVMHLIEVYQKHHPRKVTVQDAWVIRDTEEKHYLLFNDFKGKDDLLIGTFTTLAFTIDNDKGRCGHTHYVTLKFEVGEWVFYSFDCPFTHYWDKQHLVEQLLNHPKTRLPLLLVS
jgi:hypothetical protein